jgi:hypothetical protein
MRRFVRYVPLVALIPVLAACRVMPDFTSASGPTSTPSFAMPSVTHLGGGSSTPTPPRMSNSGPLGTLAIPAGAKPWKENLSQPMGLDAFVKAFYVTSAVSHEKSLYTQRGFIAGTIQGWINADGSQQSIAIIKFRGSSGALSLFDGLTGTLRDTPKPATKISDSADGGVGVVDPTLDSLGNASAEIAAHTGVYVIDVHQFDASAPDAQAAKDLMLKQYNALKGS